MCGSEVKKDDLLRLSNFFLQLIILNVTIVEHSAKLLSLTCFYVDFIR